MNTYLSFAFRALSITAGCPHSEVSIYQWFVKSHPHTWGEVWMQEVPRRVEVRVEGRLTHKVFTKDNGGCMEGLFLNLIKTDHVRMRCCNTERPGRSNWYWVIHITSRFCCGLMKITTAYSKYPTAKVLNLHKIPLHSPTVERQKDK